jgi:chromosomal replication initiation ATPase DnaA
MTTSAKPLVMGPGPEPVRGIPGIPPVRKLSEIDPKARERILDCMHGNASWPLVMVGPAGVGKTCAAAAVLDLGARMRGMRIYKTAQVACEDLILAGKGEYCPGQYPVSVGQYWRDWNGALVTCMDELGSKQTVSDHHYETVKRAIDERYGKPAIFISNLSITQLAAVYDDRIASRLSAGTVLAFSGKDRRAGA